jgi:hypothetical protein
MAKRLVSRLAVVAVVSGGALAVANPALATDYCVNTTCGGVSVGDLQSALTAAEASVDADRVFLGSGTYTATALQGFVYDQPNGGPVEIVGAGINDPGPTRIAGAIGGGGTLRVVGAPGTRLRDVNVVLPPDAAPYAVGLSTNAVASHIAVTENPAVQSNNRFGLVLRGGVLEDDSFVGIGTSNPGTTGVVFDVGGGAVRDSTVYSYIGISTGYGGTIDRTRIGAELVGVDVPSGATKITSSAIYTSGQGGVGIDANLSADASIDVDGVNIYGHGGPNSGTGISAYNAYFPNANVDVTVKNSIIRDFDVPLYAGAAGPGHAHIAAAYSDYERINNSSVGASAAISESNITNVGNANFEEEYRPLEGNALIDAGEPAAAPGLDIDGKPLVTDGNHDGVVRRDIGAFEFPGPTETSPPVGGDLTTGAGAELGGAAGPGDGQALPGRDLLAPIVSSFRTSRTRFTVGRARTATSARVARGTRFNYVLSEPAKVVVRITRVGAKRAAGKLTRRAQSGRNTIKFSGRMGSRPLKPGRYRAVITAMDAAGNRSAAKRVRFRVLRP